MTVTNPADQAARLHEWIARHVREPFTLSVEPTSTGSVNETLLVDLTTAAGTDRLVVKSTAPDGSVLRRPGASEPDFLAVLGEAGAPVPAVRFIDDTAPSDAPVFAMDRVEGRGVPDEAMSFYMGGGWLLEASEAVQNSVWTSFHDALARVHAVPVATSRRDLRAESHLDHLGYWRRSLLSVTDAVLVPRQTAALDWLIAEAPADVDENPCICMGDSRLANSIVDDGRVVALVDWELGYIGNPAADVAYSLYTDAVFSQLVGSRLPGFPDAEETWSRWQGQTGRIVTDRAYWTVHAAIVLSVTATRAIAKLLRSSDANAEVNESMNPFAQTLTELIPGELL